MKLQVIPRFSLAFVFSLLCLNSCSNRTSTGISGTEFPVSFHLQAERPNKKFTFLHRVGDPPEAVAFSNAPLFDIRDVVAFQPFQVGDGTWGATFQFDEDATRRLMVTSSAKQGQFILTKVEGQEVEWMNIDRRIDDGRMVVWQGIPANVIEDLRTIYPLINPNSSL